MTDHHDLLELTLRTVAEVVPTLLEAQRTGPLTVDTKSSNTDMVTAMDRWCEARLIERISALRPDDGFVGEESEPRDGSSGVRWIIDPIDGTTNYLYDVPGFSVSVACEVDDEMVMGVVVDPVRSEVFSAVRGDGAHRNGTPIRCSTKDELATALIGTGFSYQAERRAAQAAVLTTVLPEVRDIRRMGGAALDLCAVACGRLDGYYEKGLAWWDVAAGGLIATEAGARLTDLTGPVGQGETAVCAGPDLHASLVNLLVAAGA